MRSLSWGTRESIEPGAHGPPANPGPGMAQPKKETTTPFGPQEGDYPYICTFPGHFQLMNGVMGVSKLANPITNLTRKFYHEGAKCRTFKLEPKKTGVLANGLLIFSLRSER